MPSVGLTTSEWKKFDYPEKWTGVDITSTNGTSSGWNATGTSIDNNSAGSPIIGGGGSTYPDAPAGAQGALLHCPFNASTDMISREIDDVQDGCIVGETYKLNIRFKFASANGQKVNIFIEGFSTGPLKQSHSSSTSWTSATFEFVYQKGLTLALYGHTTDNNTLFVFDVSLYDAPSNLSSSRVNNLFGDVWYTTFGVPASSAGSEQDLIATPPFPFTNTKDLMVIFNYYYKGIRCQNWNTNLLIDAICQNTMVPGRWDNASVFTGESEDVFNATGLTGTQDGRLFAASAVVSNGVFGTSLGQSLITQVEESAAIGPASTIRGNQSRILFKLDTDNTAANAIYAGETITIVISRQTISSQLTYGSS